MRNFENWENQDLKIEFGLNQVPKMPQLEHDAKLMNGELGILNQENDRF